MNPELISSVFGVPHTVKLTINPESFLDPILETKIDTNINFDFNLPRMTDKDKALEVQKSVEAASETGAVTY